jgi:exopolyphosphatase/pppGpp-phosphohydrolase
VSRTSPTGVGAAIDVGSNSVHLLVAEHGDGSVRPIHDGSVHLGLGARVDLEGRIGPDDGQAAIEALAGFVAVARGSRADWIELLATEPLRRAADRTEFCHDVEAALGLPLHVLSHVEEALLTVLGVLGDEAVVEPTLVLDIGGGSSELSLLEPGADPVIGLIPVGSARLTAIFVEDDPPTQAEVEALRAHARRLVATMPVGRPSRGIVVGGSGMNLLHLVAVTDGEAVPGRFIDRAALARAIGIVLARPSSELASSSGLREGRILQMAAGACLIEAVLDRYELHRLEPSDASLREGAILARARAGEAWRTRLDSLVRGA